MMDKNSGHHSAPEGISRLAQFLESKYPDNILIPLQSEKKCPAMSHKGGQYTWEDWDTCMKNGHKYTDFGLLVRTMVVVDADSSEAVALLESKYPALLECPCVQTRKGKHYYFLRSNLCEEKNVTDSTGVWKQVDLKTVTNSYHEHVSGDGSEIPTAGVVVVPPSTNKSWSRSIFDTPLTPIPDEIIQDVLASRENNKKKSTGTKQKVKCRGKSTNGTQHPVVDQVKALLVKVCNDSTSVFDKMDMIDDDVLSLYFRTGPGGRQCPGRQQHSSNNFFVHCQEGGACYYLCLSSECRRRFPLGTLEHYEPIVAPAETFPLLPCMEQTLGLLRDSLGPHRFGNLQSLAGAVKSCFGKNSFHIYEKLLERTASCPPVEELERTFSSSRCDDDAGRLKRWAREDSPDKWNLLRNIYLGPPSMEDKAAAQALLEYVRQHHGFEFLYCSAGVQYFWDGERFLDNADDVHTFQACLDHGEEIARIYNVSSKMYTGQRRIKGICGVLRGLTIDRDAHVKMNQNTKLLGFEDGVLELDTGIFRPKRYSDYVTMSVGYNYPTERDPAAEAEVMEFFKQVHRNADVCKFVLYRLASCLEGHNTDEKGPMWTGASGANGKSKMAELMKAVMGEYSGTLESSQLTTARSSGAANSQLASVMFCRLLVVEEPDTMCKSWNWEKFKELTGRGNVQVRQLYERSTTMIPHFTPILIFNSLPEGCTKVDKAVQRRLEVIPFESEFVHEPTLPHQFPIDVHLSDKFASWKVHLFNILYYDYYREYVLTGRPVPLPEQSRHTANSILDTGMVVATWFNERVVHDSKGVLTFKTVKEDFYQVWIPNAGYRCDGIKVCDLKNQLTALLNRHPVEQMKNGLTNGQKVSTVWMGCRLKRD